MGSPAHSDQIMKCSKKSSAASIVMYTEEEGIWLEQPAIPFTAHFISSPLLLQPLLGANRRNEVRYDISRKRK